MAARTDAIACSACSSVSFAASACEPLAQDLQGIRFGGPLHGGQDGRDRPFRLLVGELDREHAEPLAEGLQGIRSVVSFMAARIGLTASVAASSMPSSALA